MPDAAEGKEMAYSLVQPGRFPLYVMVEPILENLFTMTTHQAAVCDFPAGDPLMDGSELIWNRGSREGLHFGSTTGTGHSLRGFEIEVNKGVC